MDQPQDADELAPQSTPQPILCLEKCLVRPHCELDAEALSLNANNPKIAKWMSNLWPHPYTLKNSQEWIALSMSLSPTRTFVICTPDNSPIGGVGLKSDVDIKNATTVELGYWLGEDHWGKGIATEVAVAFSEWTFQKFDKVQRIVGEVFGGNDGSCRVLEKAGYVFQERRKDGAKKGEVFLDLLVYYMPRPGSS